jgi:hypothetical protein
MSEARKLSAAATPGPWEADLTEPDDVVLWGPSETFLANVGHSVLTRVGIAFDIDAHNAALVAHMRNHWDAMLDRMEALERVAEAARAYCGADGNRAVHNADQHLRNTMQALDALEATK